MELSKVGCKDQSNCRVGEPGGPAGMGREAEAAVRWGWGVRATAAGILG